MAVGRPSSTTNRFGDLVGRQQIDDVAHPRIRFDGDRIGAHDVGGLQIGGVALEGAAQVAVGDDPGQGARLVQHRHGALAALGDGRDDLAEVGVQRHAGRHGGVVAHPFAHALQAHAQGAAGMVQAEIHRRELAPIHQDHGQGVAQRQCHQGRGGGRQAIGTGLCHAGHGQADGGVAAQKAGRPLGDGDDRNVVALAIDQGIAQFAALARVGDGQKRDVRAQHPQVAVAHLRRVDEEGVGAGGGQGGGDLAPDVARLAHAGDHDIARPAHDHVDGARQGHVDGALQRLQRLDVQPHHLSGAVRHGGDVLRGGRRDLGH